MKEILVLLKPRLWSFRNGLSATGIREKKLKFLLFGTIGIAFWVGIFAIFYRVLTYFQGAEAFGDILAYKLLSMTLVVFFSLLLFSSILTALSKLYLSRDLSLVHAMPVRTEKIFLARWFESALDSSWMVLIYSLPVFLSYGIVYKAGPVFYGTVMVNLVPFCLIASSLSTLIVLAVAGLLPAGRIRGIFVILAGVLFIVLVIAFRLMRPERLVNPAAFSTVMMYVKSLETPGSPFLPTTWMMDSLRAALSGSATGALFHAALSWSFSLTLIFTTMGISGAFYLNGLSKAQNVPGRLSASRRFPGFGGARLLQFLPGPVRAITVKEIRTFLRDQTQWPQLFLILALVAIYLYNFYVLPVDRSMIRMEYLQNILSFLNMGLSTFVLAALSARFVFPAVSNEGPAFWIVKSSPVPIGVFLWIKFCIFLIPLLILTETLIVASNILLDVTPFMMALSVITVFFMVPAIVAMGIGLGAAYPDFQSENPAQSATSLGGLIYMTLCAGLIGAVIVLEAGPAYTIFMAGVRSKSIAPLQWVWISLAFAAVPVICALAVILPMRWGERKLNRDSS
jgi:ABC-2 type transport system permease protein